MSVFAVLNPVVDLAHAAIESVATLITPVAGGLAVALAIVLFTMLVRLLISPLTYLQAKRARLGAALTPEIAKLREKHKDDPMTLATETLALQRANGVSPFAGLMPALVQAPFFMVMYRVALSAPAGAVFGIPLGAHLVAGWPVFGVLLICSVLLARRFASANQSAGVLRFLPYLTVATVAWMPLAGSLYLVTSTAWTAMEQALWRRPVATTA